MQSNFDVPKCKFIMMNSSSKCWSRFRIFCGGRKNNFKSQFCSFFENLFLEIKCSKNAISYFLETFTTFLLLFSSFPTREKSTHVSQVFLSKTLYVN